MKASLSPCMAARGHREIFPNDWCRGSSLRMNGRRLKGTDAAADGTEHVPAGHLSRGGILSEGLVPRELGLQLQAFRREMRGLNVPRNVYVSVCGTDLVRVPDGSFAVLEDNLRVPSGVSYMLAKPQGCWKRVFPTMFRITVCGRWIHYPQALLATLRSLAPENWHYGGPTTISDARSFRTRLISNTPSGRTDGHRAGEGATCWCTTTRVHADDSGLRRWM